MIEERVTFDSEGEVVSGLLRRPDDPSRTKRPAIVQGPGWLGLKDASLYVPYHRALVAAGFTVLVFDYRGFGDSGGARGLLSPAAQLDDLRNAVTYLTGRPDIDEDRIGVFGSGGTGGGNAVTLAAADSRVMAAVSQVPVADGADWLRRMRSGEQWDAFRARLAADRAARASGRPGEMVHPREDIMVPTAERRATSVKRDVDGRIPTLVPLAVADELLGYRPVDVAADIAPRALMVVGVEDDDVTPTDHAVRIYEAARPPKALILQGDTSHYAAYERYAGVVIPRIVDWFRRHLLGSPATPALETPATVTVLEEAAP